MNANHVYLLAVGIGIVAGLRSLTAPALVSWAARLEWLNLHGSPLAFMGSTPAVVISTLAALAELVNDLLPRTPSRTSPGPLIARILMGGLSGACLCTLAGQPLVAGVLFGAVGSLIGAFGGYQVRTRLVSSLKVKDAFIAIPEDLVAVGLAFLLVSLR